MIIALWLCKKNVHIQKDTHWVCRNKMAWCLGFIINTAAKKQSTPQINMAKSWKSPNLNYGQSNYLVTFHLLSTAQVYSCCLQRACSTPSEMALQHWLRVPQSAWTSLWEMTLPPKVKAPLSHQSRTIVLAFIAIILFNMKTFPLYCFKQSLKYPETR